MTAIRMDVLMKKPDILYVSDLQGNQPKALTSKEENFVSIKIFEKQNYALIKMLRDQNNNGEFEYEDKEYYYVKLDLVSLALGNKIELQNSVAEESK